MLEGGTIVKYQRAIRDPLRALTSEMLPYEVPLPFSAAGLYRFLKRLKFEWISEDQFTINARRFGEAERIWLRLIFDGVELDEVILDDGRIRFGRGKQCLTRRLLHPYKFRARRNNGKLREITVPHPQSMLGMAYFIDKYRDSILYFTNRSSYSIRHPHRTARVQARRDKAFLRELDSEDYGLEQFGLEYDVVTSYFAYKRYNNINRFYSSPEFRACERKYPLLVRADISKCFDSIYTHTVAWVSNGRTASKKEKRDATNATFGGSFDRYMQYLNYAETSGIVIGPEFSRIFAEIILQEVDVRVEGELEKGDLKHGRDYEIMRYVDDYFVFLADSSNSERVENVLSRHLAHFKLHLNDQKQESLETPLKSHMSIAKLSVREGLRTRTKCEIETEPDNKADLFFSAHKAIIDYKAILTDTERQHGELANSYLYELSRRAEKTLCTYGEHLDALVEEGDLRKIKSAHGALISYLVAVLDVAVFVYSGSPSVSHSLKLSRLIATSLRELETQRIGHIEMQNFRSKVRQEIIAQLSAVRDQTSFGPHTLNLVDCLFYLDPETNGATLRQILKQRGTATESLDAFALLTMLRCCGDRESTKDLKAELLSRAKVIVETGEADPDFETERAILMLTLPDCPTASPEEVGEVTGLTVSEIKALRNSNGPNMLFAWNASDHYYERLQLKSSQMVY